MSFDFSIHIISIAEATTPHGWKDEARQASRILEHARRECEIRKPEFYVTLILPLVYGGDLLDAIERILDIVRSSCKTLGQWAPW